jgi:hypothetical protein
MVFDCLMPNFSPARRLEFEGCLRAAWGHQEEVRSVDVEQVIAGVPYVTCLELVNRATGKRPLRQIQIAVEKNNHRTFL